MGFDHLRCQKAAINTSNVGVDAALTWLQSHEDDPDIDIPISEGHGSEALTTLDQSKVDHLIMFGFQEDIDRKALKASKATDWIFSNPEASVSGMDAVTSDIASISGDTGLPDGGGICPCQSDVMFVFILT
ncbi:ubiquitin carboxyl-terminal hydrolase [Medicago truncatula]|uniref:Ubiquitin carboxyl-terminal hydrolase n=1 Tax=Medicago truncatula TaxID=3880 RepID=A0A072TQW0_MEDTR|nr:ubiquitin carboxyl-terminal hydrolase [Medicago truncatula]